MTDPTQQAAAVYLVATGDTYNGLETYTRHEGHPPALCDFERLYSEPAPAAPAVGLRELEDAARYRWLRDKSEPGICAFYLSVGEAFHKIKFKPETVDQAIDAQRLGREKEHDRG